MAEIERVEFDLVIRIYYVPLSQVVTLDNDLVGTRAKDLQVKIRSQKKAEKEGQMAEVVVDAWFSAVMATIFWRRGQGKYLEVHSVL